MIANCSKINSCSFKNRNIPYVVIHACLSNQNGCAWSIHSGCFVLNPINIGELFQVLEGIVIIGFNKWINFFSQPLFNFWMITDVIQRHHEEMRCCICPCYEKSEKFFNDIFGCVFGILFSLYFTFSNESFNDICIAIFSLLFHDLLNTNLNHFPYYCFEDLYFFFDFSNLWTNSILKSFISENQYQGRKSQFVDLKKKLDSKLLKL